MEGRFSSLDAWLEKVGFTVEGVAGLPFAMARTPTRDDVPEFLLDPLRAVPKPQRLKEAQVARPSQAVSFVSERVAPPAERQKKKDVGKKSPVRAPRRRGRPRSYC